MKFAPEYIVDIKLSLGSRLICQSLRWLFPTLLYRLDNISIKRIGTGVVLTNIFFQKCLRVNAKTPFLIHYTSKCVLGGNILIEDNPESIATRLSLATAPNCYYQANNKVILGNNLFIGPGVRIISANHDPDNYNDHLSYAPITIENNVLLSANVVVLPGVTIGKNSIVGASAVVTKNIPSDSVAIGVPATHKKRSK